jgi:hypothetical protein
MRWKGTHRWVTFAVEVGLTPTDSQVILGAFSPTETTGSHVHLHDEITSGKIESNQLGCSTIRAEHYKARKHFALLIAEDESASQDFIYKENAT